MNFIKTILLTALSALLLFILFRLGPYDLWWESRIATVAEQKQDMSDITDDSVRMDIRYPELPFYRGIKNYIAEQGDQNPIMLLPPKGLVQQNKLPVSIPEPVVFYYLTGLTSYWANMPKAKESTWALIINKGQFDVVPLINNAPLRDSLIKYYQQFEISL